MQDLEKIIEVGIIKIGINVEEGIKGAPWAWHDEQTKLFLGFESDIAREVCQLMNLKPLFIPVASYKTIPDLLNNHYDICIGAIKPESNLPEIAYSLPYYQLTQQIVTLPSLTIYDLSDLRGKVAGVLSNSLGEFIIGQENNRRPTKINIKKFEDTLELFTELQFGNIDAVFIDSPVALWYSKTNINSCLKIAKVAYKSGSYSIAAKSNNKDLIEEINKALKKVDLQKILDKYGLWDESQKTN